MNNSDRHHKSQVKRQFGRSASDYSTSEVHAAGESLQSLVDLVKPESTWNVLDIATGAGHTALAFAPLVSQVVATDITDEMLETTNELALQRGIGNLETIMADAESLPFSDQSFDLVTCRLAFHHFRKQSQALAEVHRVLKPGGCFGFSDNYTVEDGSAAEFYNRFETIRDPSHFWVHSIKNMTELFETAGLPVHQLQVLEKEFEFHRWADRQRVVDTDKDRLLAMLDAVPAELQPLLKPRRTPQTAYFSLAEAVIVARKSN